MSPWAPTPADFIPHPVDQDGRWTDPDRMFGVLRDGVQAWGIQGRQGLCITLAVPTAYLVVTAALSASPLQVFLVFGFVGGLHHAWVEYMGTDGRVYVGDLVIADGPVDRDEYERGVNPRRVAVIPIEDINPATINGAWNHFRHAAQDAVIRGTVVPDPIDLIAAGRSLSAAPMAAQVESRGP